MKNYINMFLMAMFLVLFSFGCACTTVEPGEIGIGRDWNGVQRNSRYDPGFHVYGPTTSVITMSTQTQTYEMSGEDEIHVLSRDQLSVDMEVTINFSLNPEYAIDVYVAYSENYADRIIHPIVRTAVRDAASTFTAINLVDRRDEFQRVMEEQVRRHVSETLGQRNVNSEAIRIENVMVRNIELPASLNASIAAIQQQRMDTERREQAMATAAAEAARLRTEAEGEAAAILIRANAEADANRVRSASLTPAILEARRIEAFTSLLSNPSSRTIIIPAGSVPQIRLDHTSN